MSAWPDFVYLASSAVIHETATLGTKPFNFPRDPETGKRTEAPVSGSVWVGSDVEVFPHANVDRGCTQTTRIGDRVKIDHYVHVGHDSVIGEDCCLCAGAIIGGYVEIGAGTTIGLGAVILPLVKIGSNCYVGAGAVVTRNVPNDVVVAGIPARIRRPNLRG